MAALSENVAQAFRVPSWLANPHVQSLSAALPLWAPPSTFRPASAETLRIALPTDGALRAHVWWQDEASGKRPAAIIVHGVAGSSDSAYVVRAAVAMHRAGWNVVRLDLRGAGESTADAPLLYHAGLTEDLRVTLDHVASHARVDGVAFVGFSLGGHVVLRFAGELGATADGALRATVAISAPLDLLRVTRAIERLRCAPYQHYVLSNLIRQAKRFMQAHPSRAGFDRTALGKLHTIRAYDGLVIAPMHGFASAEDYYARMSAGPLVERIRVPTLLIHAEDDPMVPADSVRDWLGRAPAAVDQAWTARGGHVGWFDGVSEASWVNTWAVDRALAFLKGRLR